jgi:hypothetical protein
MKLKGKNNFTHENKFGEIATANMRPIEIEITEIERNNIHNSYFLS